MVVTIGIESSDRVAVFGQTGSGKTYMARYLLRSMRRLVVLDPKGMLRGQWELVEWSEHAAKDLREGKPVRVRVGAPLDLDWSPYLWAIYDAGNVFVYVDEMYGVVPIGKRPPDALNALYTRGRELGIGVMAVSQRPRWIPMQMISESSWFFGFRLLLEDDRRELAQIMGPAAMEPIKDRYGFFTFNAEWDQPIYTPGLEVRQSKADQRIDQAV